MRCRAEFAGRIGRRDAPQHAVGIDGHTRRGAAADRVATTATAAAKLGAWRPCRIAKQMTQARSCQRRSGRKPGDEWTPVRQPNRAMEVPRVQQNAMFRAKCLRSG